MSSSEGGSLDAATEAVLLASRSLVGVAARSLNPVAITLPQYRALVLLSERGEQNVGGLADLLAIHPSTATRLCDRLFAAGYIDRATSRENRREVTVMLSAKGRALVRKVTTRRRDEIRSIVSRLTPTERRALVDGFAVFAHASDEYPDDAWRLGWTT